MEQRQRLRHTAGELGRLEWEVTMTALREASWQHVQGCLGEVQPLDTLEGRNQEAGQAVRDWTRCPRESWGHWYEGSCQEVFARYICLASRSSCELEREESHCLRRALCRLRWLGG